MEIIETNLKFKSNPSIRHNTTHCIIHHSGGKESTVQYIHDYHLSKNWLGIAYHFYIRKDGTIYRGRPLNTIGGHTEGMNHCSIGICFEGNFTNETMTPEQLKSGQELIDYIQKTYPNIRVCRHSDHNATQCPGNIPFDELVTPQNTEPVNTDVEKDYNPSSWAKESCFKAVGLGIINGNGNGDYRWKDPVTREELCIIIDRLGLL